MHITTGASAAFIPSVSHIFILEIIFLQTHFNFNDAPRSLKSGYRLAQVLTPVKVLSLCWRSQPGTFFFILCLSFHLSANRSTFFRVSRRVRKKKVFTKPRVYRAAFDTHAGQNSAWGFLKKLHLALYDPRIHSPQVQHPPIRCRQKPAK